MENKVEYFFQPDTDKGIHRLSPDESRHCNRVLRHKQGDEIHILDGKGSLFVCELLNTDLKGSAFQIKERKKFDPPPYSIHIAIAPTKNMDRMEWFVEKSVEIGVREITPVLCAHSERRVIKTERLNKKATTALKQSGNVFLPLINNMVNYEEFISGHTNETEKFLCHAKKGGDALLMKTAGKNNNYVCLIGPEGDFSSGEIELAIKHNYRAVSLGNNRLRTETAGIVACTMLNSINA